MNSDSRIGVLFVDDSEYVLQSLRRMLWDLQDVCRMEFVGNGALALALLGQSPFDVIVADLQMPVMGGWELLDGVRCSHPAMRCFILAGDPSPADVAKAAARGYGLIAKPCSTETLKAALFGGQTAEHASAPRATEASP